MKKHPRVLATRATKKWMKRLIRIPSKILEVPEGNVEPLERTYWDDESVWSLHIAKTLAITKPKATLEDVHHVAQTTSLPREKNQIRDEKSEQRPEHRDRTMNLRELYIKGGVTELSERWAIIKPVQTRKPPRPMALSVHAPATESQNMATRSSHRESTAWTQAHEMARQTKKMNIETPLTPRRTSHMQSPAWRQAQEMSVHMRKSSEVSEIPESLRPGSTYDSAPEQTKKSVEVNEVPMSLRPGPADALVCRNTWNTVTAKIGKGFSERLAQREIREKAFIARAEKRKGHIFALEARVEAGAGVPLAPKMQLKLSAVGLHETYTARTSTVTEMAAKGVKSGKVFVPTAKLVSTEVVKADVPKLPLLRRISMMRFDGTVLAGVN
jgi:hypothetical protein